MAIRSSQQEPLAEPFLESAAPPPSPFDAILRQLIFGAEPERGTLVGVTSVIAGEGRTMAVAELAQRLSYWAAPERPVLTVDCNQLLAPNHPISRRAAGHDPPLRIGPTLAYRTLQSLQAAGLPTYGSGLASALEDLRRRYSFVVLDLPPLLGEPISLELARAVDKLYLVVRAGATNLGLARQAIELIGPAQVEGVILNQARSSLPRWLQWLVS